MKFTILGASGFVDSHLLRYLQAHGHSVYAPRRGEPLPRDESLGHVVYCIGMTGNFRSDPRGTIDAHVNALEGVLANCEMDSLLYLSSTRLYGLTGEAQPMRAQETQPVGVRPGPDQVYDLSKLLGESLCLGHPNGRVARLSNVYGAGQSEHTFLGSIVADAAAGRPVVIGEGPSSEKDYVSIDDVAPALAAVVLSGTDRIYNVASGVNVSHAEIATALTGLGCEVSFAPAGRTRRFPEIDTAALQRIYSFEPRSLFRDLQDVLSRNAHFHECVGQ